MNTATQILARKGGSDPTAVVRVRPLGYGGPGMSLDALQRRWKHAYPNGEREPLFVSLPTYCVIIAAVSLVLGVQWYFAFEFRKSYLSLTSVILVTNTIWAACGLLVWEMVQ